MKREASFRYSILFTLLCMFFIVGPIMGQTALYTIGGKVTDAKGRALDLATVSLNNELATTTKKDGTFSFPKMAPGDYTYRVSYVGYETVTGTLKVRTGKERLNVQLKESGLSLKSVTVTARQVQMGSKSVVNEDAIRHIQPKSLNDLLQLVPGNLIENPDLNSLAQAQIREIGSNAANALGTSVMVDGTPLSNDANLQVMGSNKYGTNWNSGSSTSINQTTAGKGVDLRTISAGNVESVEVISGIPSVEYGNLTSGAVIVKTKSGRTPWEAKAQVDEKSKLFFLGKGFSLKSGGALNFSMDWAQSWGDIRKHYLGYDRITASAGYSNHFGPFSLNVKGSFYTNVNNTKTDKQMTEQDYHFKNTNTGARLSLNGRYQNRNSFITGIDYNLSGQISRTLDKHDNRISNPDGVITNTRLSGVHEAQFKNLGYHSHYQIEGLPINFFAQVAANKYIQINETNYTTLKLGAEYTYDANKGDGFTYDENNPPQYSNANRLRPRAYKDIPSLQNLSVFLNDRLNLRLGTIGAQVEAGVRLSNMFVNKEKSGGNNGYFVAEPRINLSLSILNKRNNSFFDDLSVTGGFGLFNKMPTLLYLYPDAAYFDNVSLAKYSGEPEDRLALMTTDIIRNTANKNLKPAHSRKWELGLSFRKGQVKGYMTYFNENHKHELGFASQLFIQNYNVYDVPATGKTPTYDATTQDVTYADANGVLHTAGKSLATEMYHWSKPSNTSHSSKHGIEYGLDLGEWKPIRTSLSINGAWFHIRRVSETTSYNSINYNYGYESVTPAGYGSISDRVNTSFRFITHIPAVKMIFTTTVQVVWYESEQATYENEKGEKLYHRTTWSDGKDYFVVNPLGYYDNSGSYTPWNEDFVNNETLKALIPRYQLYDFKKDVIHPWALLSFRFTKEIGKVGEISFIANNFTNTKRYHTNKHSLTRTQLYPEMYFGAELKLKL